MESKWYNISFPMRQLIYLINWRASTLQMGPHRIRLTGTHLAAPKAVTLALPKWHADTSATPMPRQCLWQPQEVPPEFPQLLPPWRKFLTTETQLWLLLFRNPVGPDIRLECVLVAEIRRRDPLCILSRIPLPQD